MEHYSVIRKMEIMPFAATWRDLEIIILSEVSRRKINIKCYLLYVVSSLKDTNELISKTEIGLSFHLAYSFLCCAKAFKFH